MIARRKRRYQQAVLFLVLGSGAGCEDPPLPRGTTLDLLGPQHATHEREVQIMNQRFSGNLPFTNAEVFEAMALVDPPEVMEAFRQAHNRPADEPTDIAVTDNVLLRLAAVSIEYADRIVKFRPDLKAEVQRVRADPAAFLAEERKQAFESYERERRGHS